MYSIVTETIEVQDALTEPQFREIGRRLGQPLGRFKGWAESFTFEAGNSAIADDVCAYLREIPVNHERETTSRWVAGDGEEEPAVPAL